MSSFEVTSELYSENEFQKAEIKENGRESDADFKYVFRSTIDTYPF